jgi:hypothetical protein
MAIMLTGPSRSILARSSVMASSALRARCSAAAAAASGLLDVGALVLHIIIHVGHADRRDCTRVRRGLARGFEGRHLGKDVVQCGLQTLYAGVRQVGQVAVCRGARNVELRHGGAQRFVRAAGRADAGLDPVGTRAKGGHPVVRLSHIEPEHIERPDVRVEVGLPFDDRDAQRFHTLKRGVLFAREGHCADFELAEGVLEPSDFGGERDRPLHQRRVRGTHIRRATAQIQGRLAGLEQPSLRHRQPVVRSPLLTVQPINRRPGLLLPAIEAVTFFLSLPALSGDLFCLLGQSRPFVDRPSQITLEADDGLLLAVMLGGQGLDGTRRLRDRPVER